MFKIEMLVDDNGTQATEVVEDVHACTGEGCESPARCEDCGTAASTDTPVYVWRSSIDIDYFACGNCLAHDDFARLLSDGAR